MKAHDRIVSPVVGKVGGEFARAKSREDISHCRPKIEWIEVHKPLLLDKLASVVEFSDEDGWGDDVFLEDPVLGLGGKIYAPPPFLLVSVEAKVYIVGLRSFDGLKDPKLFLVDEWPEILD